MGTTVRHRGLVLYISDRTMGTPFISDDLNQICSVLDLHCLTQIPSKLVIAKAPMSRVVNMAISKIFNLG